MGQRPSLPDSLPVIGSSQRHTGIYYAFGHQHVGLTCAPKTGRLIADLVAGRTPDIDLEPYRVDRF
jgi:D-amino-acid dehydrogenase